MITTTPSPVMCLLAARVPIALLCDLVATGAPESATISLNERPPGDLLAIEALVGRAEAGGRLRRTATAG